MSRRPARCTEADLRRAIRAAMKAVGTRVVVEIPMEGPIRVIADPLPASNDNPKKRRIAL